MKRWFVIWFTFVILALAGCSESDAIETVYSEPWDAHPIIVEQRNNHDDYEVINEISDKDLVEKLINALKHIDWEENVMVDIRPADYRFTWNTYQHNVWHNEAYSRMDFTIEGQMGYGMLSKDYSDVVFEILLGEPL